MLIEVKRLAESISKLLCVHMRGDCWLLEGGQQEKEGKKGGQKSGWFSPVSRSSGVTLAFPVLVTQRTRTQNHLLTPHHSNYGTVKA